MSEVWQEIVETAHTGEPEIDVFDFSSPLDEVLAPAAIREVLKMRIRHYDKTIEFAKLDETATYDERRAFYLGGEDDTPSGLNERIVFAKQAESAVLTARSEGMSDYDISIAARTQQQKCKDWLEQNTDGEQVDYLDEGIARIKNRETVDASSTDAMKRSRLSRALGIFGLQKG